MPTRKQRRRQQKERRHDYEYVYVDDEGHEVEVAAGDAKVQRAVPQNGKTRQRASASANARAGARIQPPSWRRVGKRGLIFAPLMFVTVMLLDNGLELWQVAIQTAWLLAIFLPFSYFLDSMMYRRYRRRIGADGDR